ncbi:unnamed protein product [Caenorhabditis sp. 36 PRJEB53466]|nr:unnamed protein product [Caenorhabditis sp. 36 PRJEB53466]
MLSSLFALSFLFISTAAVGYDCSGQRLINPPLDLNEPYYYPEWWNETMAPATYSGSQSCEWQINVLQEMYATVTFFKDTADESGITCTYPNAQEQYIEDKDHNPYIFTYDQFKVNFRVSDKEGRFSFKVVWARYPPACQMDINLSDDQPMTQAPTDCVTTVTSPNKVLFAGFFLPDNSEVLLRQSAIYEGGSTSGRYLGNLYYARYNNIISDNNKLTVYTFGLNKNFNYSLFMVMDIKAAGDVKKFSGVTCADNSPCTIALNAENGVAAVATVSQKTDYVKQFPLFTTGTLKVYEGKISNSTLMATLNSSNFMNQLPLGVNNILKIYHLDSGRLSLPVTRNADDAVWGTAYDGRIVNIHSFDYGRTSYRQDTTETFSTSNNQKLYFTFNVKTFDRNGNTTLDTSVLRDGKVVFSETYTSSNLPPSLPLKVYGDQMAVQYQTYGNYTTGFQIDLTTTINADSDSSTTLRSNPAVVTTATASTPRAMQQSTSIQIGTSATTELVETTTKSPIKLAPPTDLSQPVYWPSIWNDSMSPIPFAAQQNCEWDVSVPEGFFATVNFYRDAPTQIGIWIEFANGDSEGIDNNDNLPFIFTAPRFGIHLGKSSQQGLFSFKVSWSKYPDFTKNKIELLKGDTPVAHSPIQGLTVFTAETVVSLVAFSLKNNSYSSLLRQSAVFDGDSTDAKSLGSLNRIMLTREAKVSSGKALSVYTFGLDQLFDYVLYMAQDHSDCPDLIYYRGLNCYSDTQCPFTLTSYSGSSAIATVDNRPEYVKSIRVFPEGATLKIYEGVINNETLISTLTKDNYQNMLPLLVNGNVKQYLLDHNGISVDLSRDANDAGWGTVFDGRIDLDQTFSTFKNQLIYFNFIVDNCDFSDSSSLAISIFKNGVTVYSETFASANLPPVYVLKVYGDKMTVKYSTFGNDQNVFSYKAVNCPTDTNCPLDFNAVFGNAVIATAGGRPEFVKGMEITADNATLKIYEGVISDETLVTSLTRANYQTRFPVELKSSIRQYVLDWSIIRVQISRDANDAKWNKVYDGRNGFVHSFYHGVSSNQQDTDETFTTDAPAKPFFNYVVSDADFTGDQTALTVTVLSDGKQISSITYNSKNLPPSTTTSVQGDSYNVKYGTNGVNTKGFRIDFSTTSNSYATATSTTGTSSATTVSPLRSTVRGNTASSSSRPTLSTSSSTASTAAVETTSQKKTSVTVAAITTATTPLGVETTTKRCSTPFSILIITVAVPYKCSGTEVINPPANISNPWFYPSTWTDKDDAPQYAGSQNCTWRINVPKGMYAYFTLKANTNKSAVLKMTDSIDYVTYFDTASMDPFFLLDPFFIVDLQASDIGTLGLRVAWNPVGAFYPSTVRVKPNSSPLAMFSGDFDNATIVESDTRVSLLLIPPSNLLTDLTPYLRLTQIFDGPSINSTFLGNLYQVMASGKNLVSSGKYLTLYALFPGFNLGNVVVLQDYFDVKDFKTYNSISCLMPNLCQVSLNATGGTAAALRYWNAPFFVKNLLLPHTNKLSVYTDFVTDAHKLADYTSDSATTSIPQKFRSQFTTFVLDKDQAVLQLTSDSNAANWGSAFEGRRGFFTSANYALSSVNQTFQDNVIGATTFNVSYTVDRAGISGAAKLHVVIYDGQNAVIDNVYSATNFPSGPVWSKGNNLYVDYQSNGVNSTGAFVSFGFDKYNSAGTYGLFASFIVALWMSLYF